MDIYNENESAENQYGNMYNRICKRSSLIKSYKSNNWCWNIKKIQSVFHTIVKYVNELDKNQYGNYLIQREQTTHCTFFQYSERKKSSIDERGIKRTEAGTKEQRLSTDSRLIIVHELLSKPSNLTDDKLSNYCLQTVLDAFQTEYNLLQEFESNMQQYLNFLMENVKVKWVELMEQAKKRSIGIYQMPPMTSTMLPDGISGINGITMHMNSMNSVDTMGSIHDMSTMNGMNGIGTNNMNDKNALNGMEGQLRPQMLLNAVGKHNYVFDIAPSTSIT